jgi:hypothetical protein
MAKKPATDTATAIAAPVDTELAIVEAAFASGNYAMVRSQAKNAASPPARELAQRLLPRIVVDRDQVLAGVVAIIVVAMAAALSLVRG